MGEEEHGAQPRQPRKTHLAGQSRLWSSAHQGLHRPAGDEGGSDGECKNEGEAAEPSRVPSRPAIGCRAGDGGGHEGVLAHSPAPGTTASPLGIGRSGLATVQGCSAVFCESQDSVQEAGRL